MNSYEALFETISVHLDLCRESIETKALITSCISCPFKEFKDEALTCVSLNLTDKVINLIPIITKSKRRIK